MEAGEELKGVIRDSKQNDLIRILAYERRVSEGEREMLQIVPA